MDPEVNEKTAAGAAGTSYDNTSRDTGTEFNSGSCGKVSVLLSIYRPDADYLRQQLRSLNAQTFPNIELLVWNDYPSLPIDRQLFEECITGFPVKFFDNGKNNGVTAAFEELLRLADSEYIAFCDQDDIWLPEKLEKSISEIRRNSAVAAVCDRALIDSDSNIICESVHHTSRFCCDTWNTGDDITARNAFFTYAPGMSITARTDAAKKALPFCKGSCHDKWVLLCLSVEGTVAYVDEPLIKYRRTGKNVSGVLNGVSGKQDYYDTRINGETAAVIREFSLRYPDYPGLSGMQVALEARQSKNPVRIFRYRTYYPDIWIYEAGLALCPDFLFRRLSGLFR